MSRLFTRLYLILLVALCLGSASSIALISGGIYRNFTAKYREVFAFTGRYIAEELGPSDDPDREVARVAREVGFPIVLQGGPEDPDLRAPLDAQGVAIALRRREAWAHVSLPGQARVAVVGPMVTLQPEAAGRGVILLGTLLLALFLGVGAAIRPTARQLQALSDAAERYGRGDLDVRAPLWQTDASGALTERFNQMAERIQALVQGQRQLLASVSHDLRTPLARLRFQLVLLEDAPEAERGERLVAMERDLEALDGLIEELLTFSRLRGGAPLQRDAVSVQALVHEAVQAALRSAAPPEITVRPGPPADRAAEAALLLRALAELLGTAGRHGGGRLEIGWEVGDGEVRLAAEDGGAGVPEADRQRIFEPFVRLESRSRGTGLGLAIVRDIAERHGGAARVETGARGGARFVITLPS
jgi:signal transduction histidine kinase